MRNLLFVLRWQRGSFGPGAAVSEPNDAPSKSENVVHWKDMFMYIEKRSFPFKEPVEKSGNNFLGLRFDATPPLRVQLANLVQTVAGL